MSSIVTDAFRRAEKMFIFGDVFFRRTLRNQKVFFVETLFVDVKLYMEIGSL